MFVNLKFNPSVFGLIGIIIALAVIGLLAGVGLYFKESQNRKNLLEIGREKEKEAEMLREKIMQQQKARLEEVGEKPLTEIGQPKSQPAAGQIDTSNWKTYRNEKYGFEVKYPDRYEIRDLTEINRKYDIALQLLIGVCDLRFTAGCDGPSIHVYKGKFREPSIMMGTYVNELYRDGLTFWLGGDRNILSTFKFITLEK